eukprot:GFUD01020608.1.p1 GENE.GFUD01020608.1~~GFUD01020608.1.p1  ORF type:complete len:614 (+),score=162.31 GFUD01020608.1:132-1973(+)
MMSDSMSALMSDSMPAMSDSMSAMMSDSMSAMMSDSMPAQFSDSLQNLLRDESHKIILTVPLESCHSNRSRHLVIVSSPASKQGLQSDSSVNENPYSLNRARMSSAYGKMTRNSETMDLDYCLLGVDSFVQQGKEVNGLGFVLKILWGTETSLDGDGGFGVHILQKHYMFKPVSLQFLWTAIQTLHAISARLKPKRNSVCVMEQDWVRSYEDGISSPQSCINEWNEMSDILSRRPLSPDELTVLSTDAASAETMKSVIKSKLREIMKTVDLDDITSKSIRLSLEENLNKKLDEFKSFIDEEILLILGQMDPASKIFDCMFLGSEWNASNLEELNANGITHILNVTREIDNFFPAVFKYMNIREYDVEETDLLQYWDETYSFVCDCMQLGGRVLVHCKMGISRSASTVCAFAMKHFGWSLEQALQHTKENRPIINPNKGFRHQLAVYEGILQASRQRLSFRKLHRSKSESSFQCKDDSPDVTEDPLVERSADGEHMEDKGQLPPAPSPIVCHCYSQLSAYFSDPATNACPTHISGNLTRTDQPTREKRFYSLPGQGEGTEQESEPEDTEEAEVEQLGEGDGVCPAQSHLSQCTCNLELELAVSPHLGITGNDFV